MNYLRFLVLVATLFLTSATGQNEPPPTRDQLMTAVAIVRNLVTVEFSYFSTAKHYGTMAELRDSGLLKSAQESSNIDFSTDQPLPGFTVRLTLSQDKNSFQLSVLKPFA